MVSSTGDPCTITYPITAITTWLHTLSIINHILITSLTILYQNTQRPRISFLERSIASAKVCLTSSNSA